LLRARVSNDALRPGQLTEVELANVDQGQQRIPASALILQKGRSLVFVETAQDAKQSHYTPRPVKVLYKGGDTLTVDGLKNGEKIAVHGVSGLKALLNGVGNE
jgi:hypothetical protein